MPHAKKNLPVILIILIALALIVFVIWVYDKRIKSLGNSVQPETTHVKRSVE